MILKVFLDFDQLLKISTYLTSQKLHNISVGFMMVEPRLLQGRKALWQSAKG